MNKFLDTKSLKFKMWTYFTVFSVFIFVMLWLFQIIFLNTYYETMKIYEIRKITKNIAEACEEKNFEEIVYQTSFNNGIFIHIYDENGALVTEDAENLPRRNYREVESVRRVLKEIEKLKTGEIKSFIRDNERPKMRMVVSGMKILKDGKALNLVLLAPLAPITATSAVLKNQLLLVTVILLLISFALSYFIAKIIAKPLVKITKEAKNLASGDYEVVFEEGGYTEINQLAQTLNFATGELKKTDDLRRDLIANVSHDLRTPLTIIKSYSEMIRDFSGENAEKRNEHTKIIIDEADKMSALVNDILELSRAESGTMNVCVTDFDLAEAVRETAGRFFQSLKDKSFVLKEEYGEGLIVRSDEQKICQMVLNLISNAVNYSGEDKTILIKVEKIDKTARFSVEDFGEGIPENELVRIWERYYRASGAGKKNAAGTGIGLSIVKAFSEALGAKYGVKSEVGKGSVFWIQLPLL